MLYIYNQSRTTNNIMKTLDSNIVNCKYCPFCNFYKDTGQSNYSHYRCKNPNSKNINNKVIVMGDKLGDNTPIPSWCGEDINTEIKTKI